MPRRSTVSFLLLGALFLSGFASLAMEFLWLGALNPAFGRGNETIAVCLALGMTGWSTGFLLNLRRPFLFHTTVAALFLTPIGSGLAGAGRWEFLAYSPALIIASLPLFIFNALQGNSAAAALMNFRRERPVGPPATAYAVQLSGALLGALLPVFWMLPSLGLRTGLRLVAALSLLAGAMARTAPPSSFNPSTTRSPLASGPTGSPSFFFLVGAAGSLAQGAWLRLAAATLGSSSVVAALAVAVPLLGSSLGGAAAAAAPPPSSRRTATAPLAALLAGVAVLAGLPLFNRIPFFLVHFLSWPHPSPGQEVVVKAILLGGATLLPALLTGVSFGASLPVESPRGAARLLGWSALGNAAGLLGSLLVFIPRWGSEKSLLAAAVAYVAAGAWSFFPRRARCVGAAAATGFLAAAVAPPLLDPLLLSSGTFLYGGLHREEKTVEDFAARLRKNRLLFYREGPTAAVAVLETPEKFKILRLNGKTDGSSGFDMGAQRLLARLPLRFVPDRPRVALVIGFGSGVTAGTVAADDGTERVDAVEIEPAVLEAGRRFRTENIDALDNPVLHPVRQDARRWMARPPRRYDLITSEPSNLWTAGSASLFTREFFTDLSRALKPGGVLCQWVHGYGIREADFRSVLGTFASVFSETRLYVLGDDFFLLGSDRPLVPDGGAPQSLRDTASGLFAVQEKAGASYQALMALDDNGLRAFSAGATIQTDDRPFLEMAGLRSAHLNEADKIKGDLLSASPHRSFSRPNGKAP